MTSLKCRRGGLSTHVSKIRDAYVNEKIKLETWQVEARRRRRAPHLVRFTLGEPLARRLFSAPRTACVPNSPRYQGEAVVRRSRHFAAFSSSLQHFGPQRRAVHSDFANGDDQLTVQSYKGIEFLNDLWCEMAQNNALHWRMDLLGTVFPCLYTWNIETVSFWFICLTLGTNSVLVHMPSDMFQHTLHVGVTEACWQKRD